MDIVICVGPKDREILRQMIPFTKKNILNYRNIYLICSPPCIDIDGTISIDETQFMFSKSEISAIIKNSSRVGWYLQQLLKLYAGFCIPDLLENYLVIDSDTFFLKPTLFLKDDQPIFTTGSEYHFPYFDHMIKLHPNLKKVIKSSGIAHHMVFNKKRVQSLFSLVENFHKREGDFWKIFLENIDPRFIQNSGASEYEIYFSFNLLYFPNLLHVRNLNWVNSNSINSKNKQCDYVSIHWYLR